MDTDIKIRGGARKGAGRKKLEGDYVTKQVQFRLTEKQAVVVKKFVQVLKEDKMSQYEPEHLLKCLRRIFLIENKLKV